MENCIDIDVDIGVLLWHLYVHISVNWLFRTKRFTDILFSKAAAYYT